ncbi:dimethylmenaquinone methyltransferase [Rhodococcus sp. 15-649-1-2]|nr:RraA family protein [Rhodococcus sp. 15-649-1-2]OZE84851.1 dimethylmenaquinone methyltransferase [Rhodococcus sp. 15-649-1-2]
MSTQTRRPEIDETTFRHLTTVGTSTLGHHRDHGFVTELHPISRPIRLTGVALTVQIGEYDASALKEALDHLTPGTVLVVSQPGSGSRASIGGIVAHRIAVSGANGIVINGAITDFDEIAASGLPVYYRSVSPRTTRRIGGEGSVGQPVDAGGAVIATGDIVFGDSDGIAVLTQDEAPAVVADLAEREAREPAVKARITEEFTAVVR